MNKREAQFSIKFRHWLMSKRDDAKSEMTCSYEIKSTRGKERFALRELKEAQIDYGKAIKYGKKGVLIRTEGQEGLPDYIFMKNQPARVVIHFPQGFVICDIEAFDFCKKKSLNWEEIQEYSIKTIE